MLDNTGGMECERMARWRNRQRRDGSSRAVHVPPAQRGGKGKVDFANTARGAAHQVAMPRDLQDKVLDVALVIEILRQQHGSQHGTQLRAAGSRARRNVRASGSFGSAAPQASAQRLAEGLGGDMVPQHVDLMLASWQARGGERPPAGFHRRARLRQGKRLQPLLMGRALSSRG